MLFLRIFKHLLPRARAWKITVDKSLRRLFNGLSGAGSDLKDFVDGVWSDAFPDTTRELDEWEGQLALPGVVLTEQERRDRIAAAWKATGGQSPGYIQDTLRGAGFDVYVHEWWEPGTEPAVGVAGCATARNPLLVLRRRYSDEGYVWTCGTADATAGNPDVTCGGTVEPPGYPLVNKVTKTVPDYVNTCGNPDVTCGNLDATCGNYSQFRDVREDYIIPLDPDKWAHFLYIGGAAYGDLATVPVTRRDEFERLCLKIAPTQAWLGIIVQYT